MKEGEDAAFMSQLESSSIFENITPSKARTPVAKATAAATRSRATRVFPKAAAEAL